MSLDYNIDFIRDKKKKTNIKKAISLLERGYYTGKEVTSFFLDPFEKNVIENIANKNNMDIKFIGANENAERKIFVVNNYDYEIDQSNYIRVLTIDNDSLKHRDVLGALISKGIDREDIGDIVVGEKIEFVVLEKDAAFIKYNITKIKNVGVNIEFKKDNKLSNKVYDYEEFTNFVSSLRIDNIISTILHLSRNNAKNLIKKRLVKVDFVTVDDPSKDIDEKSLISIRGYGRFVFDEIIGNSKKGNYHIRYKKVI